MRIVAAAALILFLCPVVSSQEVKPDPAAEFAAYGRIVGRTVNMVRDPAVAALAAKHGLNAVNVTWEDTGRFKGSCVGPNISDMTIQVQLMDPMTEKFTLHCMPVIRFDNFSDKSADLSPDKFQLLVGNQKGGALQRVTLREFLGNFRKYLTNGDSWKGDRASLLADRDTAVLVSAQACFLPIPRNGQADFNPVLFNYQSYEGDPAVLTILCTREGTSATIIDNKRDAFQAGASWGQRLFFNQKGSRASLTGKRLSDFKAEAPKPGGPPVSAEANEQSGLNMVLLIQVPLKQKNPRSLGFADECKSGDGGGLRKAGKERVEDAVIGHGRAEGPYTEIAGLEIQRDARFPVRVTVQFYKATSDGAVTADDMASIAAQINKVYQNADFVGSLVTQGNTGRATEYDGDKTEPPGWWSDFWKQHEANTGLTRVDTMAMLRNLLGKDWNPTGAEDLGREVKKALALPK